MPWYAAKYFRCRSIKEYVSRQKLMSGKSCRRKKRVQKGKEQGQVKRMKGEE